MFFQCVRLVLIVQVLHGFLCPGVGRVRADSYAFHCDKPGGGRMVTTETHNQDFNTFFVLGAPVCNAYERIIVSSIPGSAFIKCSLLDLIETFTAAQINTYERL